MSEIGSSTVAGPIFRVAVVSVGRPARHRRGGYVPPAFICLHTQVFKVVILCEQGAAVVLVPRDVVFRVLRDGIVRVIKLGPGERQSTLWYLD